DAGVGTARCAVRRTPAGAAPSVAVMLNRSLIDAHVPAGDDEVAAVLEAEALVVGANAGLVAEAVEAEELAAVRGGGHVRPLHERAPDALPGTRPPHRELVHVG